ncbi:MAG: hypothetical protein LAP38_10745 [Acidobacteriia bacterium]|nr:hypothetical protein [Terriglobia bacterium]
MRLFVSPAVFVTRLRLEGMPRAVANHVIPGFFLPVAAVQQLQLFSHLRNQFFQAVHLVGQLIVGMAPVSICDQALDRASR